MAGRAPHTKDWTARENAHKPAGLHVIVGGVVEVSDANKTPLLAEGSGGAPETLVLDLTIAACTDPAIDAKVWKSASFHKVVTANQFNHVQVRWQGAQIAAFPVVDDKEHGALLDVQAKAQNAVAQKTMKKPAAKKPAAKKSAAKKPAAKKTAKKSAKKTAKKAAKKVAKASKKATKKVAKKAAKKSGLKKLVRKLVKKLTPKKKDRKGKRR